MRFFVLAIALLALFHLLLATTSQLKVEETSGGSKAMLENAHYYLGR